MIIRKSCPLILFTALLAAGCANHHVKIQEEDDEEVIEKSEPSDSKTSEAEDELPARPSAHFIKISEFQDWGHLDSQAGNNYRPENLADGNPSTAWALPVKKEYADFGPLHGPVFTLVAPSHIEAIDIMNGYGKSHSSFINNTRAA